MIKGKENTITVLLFLVSNLLFAQMLCAQDSFSFERITTKNGLSDNQAICIHQDKEGFIWIGTMSGLNRYDGKTIRSINKSSSDNTTFYNQRINKIEEDDYGNLWLHGFGGVIQVFNKSTQSIKNFPMDFGEYPKGSNYSLFLHDHGFAVMAFKDIGVFVVDVKTDSYQLLGHYPFDGELLERDTHIKGIFATNTNNIWLDTRSGPVYLKIDPNTKKWEFEILLHAKHPNTSTSNLFQKDFSLFFAVNGKGLVKYDVENKTFYLFEHIAGIDLKNITYISGVEDKIWLSTTNNGLICLSAESGKLISHVDQYNNKPLGYIHRPFIASDYSVWFHAKNFQGFFRFSPISGENIFYPYNLTKSEKFFAFDILAYFEEDTKGNIWIGTRQDGIIYYDKHKRTVKQILNNPNNPASLISNCILTIFTDQRKNIWIGTQYGISTTNIKEKIINTIIPDESPKFEFDNKIHKVFKDSYGNIWCSTLSDKIFVYDKNLKLKYVFFEENGQNNFIGSGYFSFCEDSKGRLWLGSKGSGLFMLDLKKFHDNLHNARFTQFSYNASDEYSINGNNIYDILEDNENRIWIALFGGGLDLVVEKNNQFLFLSYNQFLDRHSPITIDQGRCLMQDRNGKIWYGGVNGLLCFLPQENNNMPVNVDFYYFNKGNKETITYNDINTVYQGKDGKIWIGTYGGGLNAFVPETKKFVHYSITDGLSNNIVYGIIEDRKEDLWISTKNGLSKYNIKKDHFINYTVSEGLPTNEFCETKPLISNVSLFFGTINGIIHFKPEDLDTPKEIPEILFTDLLVSNKVIEVNKEGPLTNDINLAEEIRLNYNQNNFSISYVTNDFQIHDSQKFEYILNGFDDKWYIGNKYQTITYTNIPPGNYTLVLKLTSDIDGEHFHKKELKVIIVPPVWKTNWAYAVYLAILIFIFHFLVQSLRRFNALRNSLRLEKEVTNFKLTFLTNISHELRTPLTLIIQPIKDIFSEHKINDQTRSLLEIASHNADKLLILANEIMDFRRLQTNSEKLNVKENEVVTFFNDTTEDFIYVAKKYDIKYERFINVSEKNFWFDPEKIEKIINNLLTNAFKFTAPKGKVIITLHAESDKFSITVEDTGKGIDLNRHNKIFNRFYNKDSAFFSQGAGIGLSLVKEFVKLHNGNLDIFSEENIGTKFVVIIPGRKEDYTEEELSESCNWETGVETGKYIKHMIASVEEYNEKTEVNKKEYKMLLVENNQELLNMLYQKLKNCYAISTASNGLEGLKAANKEQPDIIITDLLMPGMNGMDMTREIKNNFETCHIPVIMLTAKSTAEDRIEGYDIGADAYITKPFDFEVLIGRINNLLTQRKLLKQKFNNDLNFKSNSIALNFKDQEFIESTVKLVVNRMEDSNFNLEDIYRELGYSKTVFFNKIKALTGHCPSNFIRKIKLNEAARMLRSSGFNVSEVAARIGYSDINFFRRQFKKQFSKTPSEFMKS